MRWNPFSPRRIRNRPGPSRRATSAGTAGLQRGAVPRRPAEGGVRRTRRAARARAPQRHRRQRPPHRLLLPWCPSCAGRSAIFVDGAWSIVLSTRCYATGSPTRPLLDATCFAAQAPVRWRPLGRERPRSGRLRSRADGDPDSGPVTASGLADATTGCGRSRSGASCRTWLAATATSTASTPGCEPIR